MDEAGHQTDLGEVLIPTCQSSGGVNKEKRKGVSAGRREAGGPWAPTPVFVFGAVDHSSNGSPAFLPHLEQQFPDPAVSAL